MLVSCEATIDGTRVSKYGCVLMKPPSQTEIGFGCESCSLPTAIEPVRVHSLKLGFSQQPRQSCVRREWDSITRKRKGGAWGLGAAPGWRHCSASCTIHYIARADGGCLSSSSHLLRWEHSCASQPAVIQELPPLLPQIPWHERWSVLFSVSLSGREIEQCAAYIGSGDGLST